MGRSLLAGHCHVPSTRPSATSFSTRARGTRFLSRRVLFFPSSNSPIPFVSGQSYRIIIVYQYPISSCCAALSSHYGFSFLVLLLLCCFPCVEKNCSCRLNYSSRKGRGGIGMRRQSAKGGGREGQFGFLWQPILTISHATVTEPPPINIKDCTQDLMIFLIVKHMYCTVLEERA